MSRFFSKRRWGDNNRHYGPLTVSAGDYKRFGVMFDSGAGEDGNEGCHVRVYLWGTTLLLELPNIIPDYRIKHIADWDAATVARMGRNYWHESFAREYGFCYGERALHVHYGPQTHSSLDTKSKVFFIPWLEQRFVRMSHFDLSGKEIRRTDGRGSDYEFERSEALPKARFEFNDYDGKRIVATTHIEEMEWKRGTGWFKWLSLFYKPTVRRSLSLNFSEEDRRKVRGRAALQATASKCCRENFTNLRSDATARRSTAPNTASSGFNTSDLPPNPIAIVIWRE